MKIKYKKDIILLLGFLVLVYIWAGFMEEFMEDSPVSSLFWLGVVILVTPLITILRGWFGIRVFRILPEDRHYAGDSIRINIEVKNSIYIPFLWLKVIDQYPLRYMSKHDIEGGLSKPIHFLSKESKGFNYVLDDVPRGILKWSKISVARTDLLGFVFTTKEQNLSQDILVYPKYINVDANRLLNNTDEDKGLTKLSKGKDYSHISGVREYERGDKLSLIHWKVSARRNSLMSKEFFPILNQETHIVLDCNSNSYPGEYNKDFELAVSVAASLAISLAKQGLVLRLNNRQREVITFKNQSYFVSKVMAKLAHTEADGNQHLERLLNHHYFNENKGITLFIITNKVTGNILNKLSTGKVKAKIFLVGESIQWEAVNNYSFVRHVKSLDELKAHNGTRRVSND